LRKGVLDIRARKGGGGEAYGLRKQVEREEVVDVRCSDLVGSLMLGPMLMGTAKKLLT